ncbi:hypothetical protein K3495_g11100 [Podosphaera aphanis]|nr:hypothetical protein K3495_g11100 [Podosphaera aphanis]
MKMGENQRWSTFYLNWASKLMEAEGDVWSDRSKTTLPKNGLNEGLRQAVTENHLLPRDNFSVWVRIVGRVALQVEEAANRSQRNGRRTTENRNTGVRFGDFGGITDDTLAPISQPRHAVDGSGDVLMGGVNMALVRKNDLPRGNNDLDDGQRAQGVIGRSRWKTQQIERLKRDKRCYGCERKGCNTRICPLLPAV